MRRAAAIFNRVTSMFGRDADRFLREVSGVVHVGASIGQERVLYRRRGLRVLWIEPNPEAFRQLQENLRAIPGQAALQGLITDRDDAEYVFRISNYDGESSSIFEFCRHSDIWPDVQHVRKLAVRSVTLPSLIRRAGINLAGYQALILDVEGAELLILKGSEPILRSFRFIKLEAADFEAYKGGCQLREIMEFLEPLGYREISRERFAEHPGGGGYYNIVCARGERPSVSQRGAR